jgi:hypothetical protein
MVVAVRNGFVSARGPMHVTIVVTGTPMGRRALRWVLVTHGDCAFVDVIAVKAMQMAVVQVIGVPVVLNGLMAAAGPVAVYMIGVRSVLAHVVLSMDVRFALSIGVSARVAPVKRRHQANAGRHGRTGLMFVSP